MYAVGRSFYRRNYVNYELSFPSHKQSHRRRSTESQSDLVRQSFIQTCSINRLKKYAFNCKRSLSEYNWQQQQQPTDNATTTYNATTTNNATPTYNTTTTTPTDNTTTDNATTNNALTTKDLTRGWEEPCRSWICFFWACPSTRHSRCWQNWKYRRHRRPLLSWSSFRTKTKKRRTSTRRKFCFSGSPCDDMPPQNLGVGKGIERVRGRTCHKVLTIWSRFHDLV